MPAAGIEARGITSRYREMGTGMQWDVLSPTEIPSTTAHLTGTAWHSSTRLALASYGKIEPFFIEK